jgi:gamma-glutamyltranspeptidase/glutathione hydrolase
MFKKGISKKAALVAGLMLASATMFGCANSGQQAAKPADQKAPAATTQKRDIVADKGVVAAAQPLAAQVGVDVLKKGGNAFDAAVATSFSLGVVEPNATSMGGGGFAILYVAKENKAYVVDFRECAPAKATPSFFKLTDKGQINEQDLLVGWSAVGVPGELRGMEMINQKFGTMKWADLIAPAIKQAEEGITVSQTLYNIEKDEVEHLSKAPSKASFFEKTFYKDGLPVEKGQKVVNKDYAESLKKVAKGGADVLYKGEIADAIVKSAARDGKGWITKEDLANYKAILREPLQTTYRGYTIDVLPPPSSGGLTVAEMLNIMEGYDIAKMKAGSADYIHTFIEAQKLAFADRNKYMADPAFTKVPTVGLLNKKYAETLRAKIDPKKATSEKAKYSDPIPFERPSTTSFSVIDKDGNMITITQTINDFFGAGVVPDGTGIMMNNEMDDFSTDLKSVNCVAPGKRPLSSMSPVIVSKDGKPFMTVGTPGGPRIISAITNILVNVIDFGMDIQPAINAARFHNPNGKDSDIEKGFPETVMKALTDMGHTFKVRNANDLFFGGVQGILYGKDGKLHGGADPRRDGQALGY